jgi:hypothetical protein
LPGLFLYFLFVLGDLLRSHLGMLILDKGPILRKSDDSRDAWVRFSASALFKANDGRDVLQVEFSTNQRSFWQIYINCILWERAIEYLDIAVIILKIMMRDL